MYILGIIMIKNITIKNFRSLNDISISLEKDVNVIIGENDTGKTSFIDVLKLVFENQIPEDDDFYNDSEEISLKINLDDKTFMKSFKKGDSAHSPELYMQFSEADIINLEKKIGSSKFTSLDEEKQKEKLREIAITSLGFKIGGNISRLSTIKQKVEDKIGEIKESEYLCEVDSIPEYNTYFLGGTEFQDINQFFEQTFFKDIKRNIWFSEAEDGVTIEDLILSELENYSENLIKDLEDKGIKYKLKQYLKELTDVKVETNFNPRDINIDVKVKLLEGENTIFVHKKGDGTRRRITMALLEYETEKEKEEPSIYVFDEPDTHLHVNAQYDFFDIIRKFNEKDRQVIITTHSPFIMNAVNPEKIRFLSLDEGKTKIQTITDENDDNLRWTLHSLGIANTHLFFSKKVLVVEGYAEKDFMEFIYPKLHDTSLRSDLIKLIRCDGIDDASSLSKVLEEFVGLDNIYVLIDNDASRKTLKLIDAFKIPNDNVKKIGHKEFEDSFDSKIIYESWKEYVEEEHKELELKEFKDNWTHEEIERIKTDCITNNKKFSEKLISFSEEKCLVNMGKPELARALAKKVQKVDLDPKLIDLLENLRK